MTEAILLAITTVCMLGLTAVHFDNTFGIVYLGAFILYGGLLATVVNS